MKSGSHGASGIAAAPGRADRLVCLNITAREAGMSKISLRWFLWEFGQRGSAARPWRYNQDTPGNPVWPVLAGFMLYCFNHWWHMQGHWLEGASHGT
jgi:hypothetical protein